MNLRRELREHMQAHGWRCADLAARLKVDRGVLARYLDGEHVWWPHDTAAKIAALLGCQPRDVELAQRAEFVRASLGPCCPRCGSELLDRVSSPLREASLFQCRACDWGGSGRELVSRPGPMVRRPRELFGVSVV